MNINHRLQRIFDTADRRSRALNAAGKFDKHFTRTVFRDLIADPQFRKDYETEVGGNAYQNGLPSKRLNGRLGQCIKNAVPDAFPLCDQNGRPRRVQVRNEPIQSYTLLAKP